jgi:hypothetical protein
MLRPRLLPLGWSSPFLGLALATAMLALASCSSSKEAPADFADPEGVGRYTNPDGVAYPSDNLGGAERAGTRPGQRIPNFTFQAYVDGDRAAGLKTISLADYLDPTQKNFKIIDLQVAATWCSVCSSVASATVPVKERLAREGVVFLEVIVAGNNSNAGPSLEEVDAWIGRHGSNLTTAIDVRARRLGAIGIDRAAVPYDLLIDTRTMEILDSSVGAPRGFDIESYVREGLQYVTSHGPSY